MHEANGGELGKSPFLCNSISEEHTCTCFALQVYNTDPIILARPHAIILVCSLYVRIAQRNVGVATVHVYS